MNIQDQIWFTVFPKCIWPQNLIFILLIYFVAHVTRLVSVLRVLFWEIQSFAMIPMMLSIDKLYVYIERKTKRKCNCSHLWVLELPNTWVTYILDYFWKYFPSFPQSMRFNFIINKKRNVWPWLVWLSGLSTGLWTKGSPVQFPVRAHAWVVGQIPSWECVKGNHTLMFLSLSFSVPSLLSKKK